MNSSPTLREKLLVAAVRSGRAGEDAVDRVDVTIAATCNRWGHDLRHLPEDIDTLREGKRRCRRCGWVEHR
jgi:hypothetical protein